MRFRPTARELFPELADRKLTPRMEGKDSIEVPLSEFPELITASEIGVHAIVYLNRHPSATGKLVQLPNGTATERTRQELYSRGEIRAKHERILEMLSAVPTFDLYYCELDQAVRRLERLARTDERVTEFPRS
jgi:hypothetical protein